ncbi:BMP family ABC transporter substrate-binding protein [Thermus oshimai]|jgi:basic membrane protein A|uniref:Putative ABC-type transport system, periplasmic component/surface lipoprotein n=1 Tax=Thermus oshimai JL-2 TaxID=751945 RepID=K7QYV8_THEOS|nr:BMP family ABC transporter substrate-binding protein [Thermus oshimai]AFV75910.1 putative ABC-type transport system, periplasmic component/surface lipoprotein [Thermus oshimai JL-2]
MKRWIFLLALALGLALGQEAKLKACFIYVGPIGDAGWTYAHDVGRKKAEAALPWLETKYVESVPEAQVVPVIDRLVREGCRVVFATSFGYMDGVLEAARKYPDVIFAHATGIKRAPNVATYMADFYQVYYLNGLAAGALTKTGKVGYVAAFPIPEVKRHINAFALGVRAVNPKAQVLVRWINAWYDPAKAREATEALLAQGADVFAFTEDTPTVIQTAARKGAYSFGHYTPMLKFAPDHVVSGQIVHWDVIYIDFLKKVREGVYTPKNLEGVDYFWLLQHKAVEMGADYGVPINPKHVPLLKAASMTVGGKKVAVYDRIMALLKDMSSPKPTFDPFTGPIRDRKGVVRVPAGRKATLEELLTLEWAAPGVVGDWPGEPK